jgi:hypothetical protein
MRFLLRQLRQFRLICTGVCAFSSRVSLLPLIVSDDRAIKASLHELIALLRSAGAQIADGLVITCASGALSLKAPGVRRGAMLIRLPENCFVPLTALRLALVGDEIVISSARSQLNSITVAITEAMLEIYNLTGKIAQHRRTSPWSLIAAHPDLLSYVVPPTHVNFPFSAKDVRSGNDAKVMLASFLHSRLFSHKQTEQAKPRPVLLPITDFLDHHWKGEPYSYDGNRAVVMRRSAPVTGKGDQCFARYGLNDAYDNWLIYGFVDEDVPFVQSVATTLSLPGVGTIRIGCIPTAYESDETEPSLHQLLFSVPRILSRKGNRLSAGATVIPGPQAPRALRRSLRVLIRELGAPWRQHSDLVIRAEEQILDANLTYYDELKSCLERLSVANDGHSAIRANFVRLCDQQVRRIRNYVSYAAG